MGSMKREFEKYHLEEMMKESYYEQLYNEEKLYSERNGDEMELIDVETCEDSGMGDGQHQNLSWKR